MPRAEWFFLSQLLQRFKEKNEQIRDIEGYSVLFDDNHFTTPDDVPIIEIGSDDGDDDV